jgi:hypothetical protein
MAQISENKSNDAVQREMEVPVSEVSVGVTSIPVLRDQLNKDSFYARLYRPQSHWCLCAVKNALITCHKSLHAMNMAQFSDVLRVTIVKLPFQRKAQAEIHRQLENIFMRQTMSS